MLIKKILETRLDIANTNDIFCADYGKNALLLLKDKYTKRCFKSVYVLDVLHIIKRSAIHCKNKVADGSGYMDVTFEVSGIIYEKGEVIHNCKIIQINNNGIMHAKSEHASLFIKNIDDTVIFKEMDEIPVIVNMAKYGMYETEISVSSYPFMPLPKKSIILKIIDDSSDLSKSDKITESIGLDISTELKKLESEITKIKKTNKPIYEFFKDLIYPYKSFVKIAGTSNIITYDNLSKTLAHDDLVYKPESYLDDNTYLTLNSVEKSKIESLYTDTVLIEVNKNDFIIHLLNEYSKNLSQFLGFLQMYDTKKKIADKKPIWSLYHHLKS